eukprot:2067206-Amphidinium_carterae.1
MAQSQTKRQRKWALEMVAYMRWPAPMTAYDKNHPVESWYAITQECKTRGRSPSSCDQNQKRRLVVRGEGAKEALRFLFERNRSAAAVAHLPWHTVPVPRVETPAHPDQPQDAEPTKEECVEDGDDIEDDNAIMMEEEPLADFDVDEPADGQVSASCGFTQGASCGFTQGDQVAQGESDRGEQLQWQSLRLLAERKVAFARDNLGMAAEAPLVGNI